MAESIGLYANGAWKVPVASGVLILMQMLMILARLFARRLKKARPRFEDYVLIMSTALSVALCILAIISPGVSGIPCHNVEGQESHGAQEFFVAWMIVHGLAICAAKWSILLLYLRVFSIASRRFRYLAYSIGVLITCTAIMNTAAAIHDCWPMKTVWLSNTSLDRCRGVLVLARIIAVPNILTGLVIIIMPLPQVRRLNASTLQRVALSATFLHGFIGVMASVAYLVAMCRAVTWDQDSARTIWAINEPANYVIAACLPTLKPVLMHLLPSSWFILSRPRNSPNDNEKGDFADLAFTWPNPNLSFQRDPNSRHDNNLIDNNNSSLSLESQLHLAKQYTPMSSVSEISFGFDKSAQALPRRTDLTNTCIECQNAGKTAKRWVAEQNH